MLAVSLPSLVTSVLLLFVAVTQIYAVLDGEVAEIPKGVLDSVAMFHLSNPYGFTEFAAYGVDRYMGNFQTAFMLVERLCSAFISFPAFLFPVRTHRIIPTASNYSLEPHFRWKTEAPIN